MKDNIGRLLGVYFEETRTRFYGLGSTTFKAEAKRRGALDAVPEFRRVLQEKL